MSRLGQIGAPILVLMIVGCHPREESLQVENVVSTQPSRPSGNPVGSYDGEIRAALAACVRDLRLDETDLKDVAPQYLVDPGPPLTWPQALARADADFKADPDKRALFLAKFIRRGDPAERVAELRLPDMGMRVSTGSRFTATYDLGVPKERQSPRAQTLPSSGPGSVVRWRTLRLAPEAPATLHFTFSHSGEVLGRPILEIRDFDFRGTRYTSLDFEMDDKLYGFVVKRKPRAEIDITIGGNTSGMGHTNYYYGVVSPGNGTPAEHLDFTPDLKLARRYVHDSKTQEALYVDKYENDKPVRRCYYKTIHTAAGTSTEIDHYEDLK